MKFTEISLVIKVAGVGLLVAAGYQVLSRSGRDEQAMLLSLAGVVIVLLMLVGKVGELFGTIRDVFGV